MTPRKRMVTSEEDMAMRDGRRRRRRRQRERAEKRWYEHRFFTCVNISTAPVNYPPALLLIKHLRLMSPCHPPSEIPRYPPRLLYLDVGVLLHWLPPAPEQLQCITCVLRAYFILLYFRRCCYQSVSHTLLLSYRYPKQLL